MYSMRINWFLSMAQILSALLPHANNISGYYYLLFVNSQSALFSFKVPVDDCFSQSIGDLLFPHKMPKYLFTKIIRHFDHCHDKVSNLLIMNFKSSNFCYWNILFASDFIYQLSARLMEFRACIIHFSSKHQSFVRQIPSPILTIFNCNTLVLTTTVETQSVHWVLSCVCQSIKLHFKAVWHIARCWVCFKRQIGAEIIYNTFVRFVAAIKGEIKS